MQTAKKLIAFLLAAVIVLSFAGCRVRTTKTGRAAPPPEIQQVTEKPTTPEIKNEPVTLSEQATAAPKPQKPTVRTPVSPAAKSTVGKSTASKSSGTSSSKSAKSGGKAKKASDKSHGTIRDENGSDNDESDSNDLNERDENAPQTPTQTALKRYGELLDSNVATIYECQKMYVYCECTDDYRAANYTDNEHRLITKAGGINLGEHKMQRTDDDWVLRKNPNLIVKFVHPDVLGKDIFDTSAAQSIKTAILSRENVSETEAGKSENVLILSTSLLDSDAGKTTASILIARAIYPALYEDIIVEEAYAEMAGAAFDGIYYYN